jgi:hypothetical protein
MQSYEEITAKNYFDKKFSNSKENDKLLFIDLTTINKGEEKHNDLRKRDERN